MVVIFYELGFEKVINIVLVISSRLSFEIILVMALRLVLKIFFLLFGVVTLVIFYRAVYLSLRLNSFRFTFLKDNRFFNSSLLLWLWNFLLAVGHLKVFLLLEIFNFLSYSKLTTL